MKYGVIKYFSIFFICVALFSAQDAFAHKVKIFATAQGREVTGTVYFPGGGKARNVTVSVLNVNDKLLGQITTNEHGEFVYSIKNECNHVFLVDTGDGHKASFTIDRDELSNDFPEINVQEVKDNSSVISKEDFLTQEIISKILSRQIRPLRQQLEQYEEAIRMRDIIGGIGYIVGIMGLLAFFLKKKDKADKKI